MPGEVRHLLAIYLLFMAFLGATTIGAPEEAAPAIAAGLAQAADPAFIYAALREAGLRPSPAVPGRARLRLWARAGIGRESVWVLPPGGEPEGRLRRTALDLARAAAGRGWRIQEGDWAVSHGRLSLALEAIRDDGTSLPLWLEMASAPARPAMIERRPARSPAVPPPRPRLLPPLAPPRPPPSSPGPRVAIILDDVGEVPGTEAFLALPARLCLAILPFSRYAETYARQAAAAGCTVLLHLPLEATGGEDPGRGAIKTSWPEERIREQLLADLAAVPGAVGVNNHMGSLGTSDEATMRVILSVLKEEGLFFVDSRTASTSVADRIALAVGERYARRDLFLDPEGASAEEIGILLRRLMALAKRDGSAIGICHANRPHTLAALRATLPEFAAAGVAIVPVTELCTLPAKEGGPGLPPAPHRAIVIGE